MTSGLKTVGTSVKKVSPMIEKGISGVYGALATGFDFGIKSVKKIASRKQRSSSTKKNRRH
jgi:hypothetical protein